MRDLQVRCELVPTIFKRIGCRCQLPPWNAPPPTCVGLAQPVPQVCPAL
jgi:hypothetical protein